MPVAIPDHCFASASDQALCRSKYPAIGNVKDLGRPFTPTSSIRFLSHHHMCPRTIPPGATLTPLILPKTGQTTKGQLQFSALCCLVQLGPENHLSQQCVHLALDLNDTTSLALSRVFLQFEAVSSAFYCWVNGAMVGYAQDTFLSSEFDVTELLKAGSNHLAVQVSRLPTACYNLTHNITSIMYHEVRMCIKCIAWQSPLLSSSSGCLFHAATYLSWEPP